MVLKYSQDTSYWDNQPKEIKDIFEFQPDYIVNKSEEAPKEEKVAELPKAEKAEEPHKTIYTEEKE